MTRQRWFGWMAAGVAVLAAAGWLYAQDGGQRPPQGGDGPGGQGPGRGQMFRPMMMPAQMVATADYVFIVRGNTLYKYDIKELKLQGKAELEMPAPPRPPQEGGQQQPPPPPPQQ